MPIEVKNKQRCMLFSSLPRDMQYPLVLVKLSAAVWGAKTRVEEGPK